MIPHAGLTLGRSKQLKSLLYSPPLVPSNFSEFIVASHWHIALLTSECYPRGIEMGYEWGYEISTAENTPCGSRKLVQVGSVAVSGVMGNP